MRTYIAIDLKSFYASVECIDRNLDPLNTNLVVANEERTEKTICLAVSPSLKAYGIPGRARLFEVIEKVKNANAGRKAKAPHHRLTASSTHAPDLARDASLALDYIIAPPRMARYIEMSTKIYRVYLRFIAPEDIHVYSIDEVFIDAAAYLATYKTNAEELTREMIHAVFNETGITATGGIGSNLYLAKVAMDIMAKHAKPDEYGVRIATLDEMSYRSLLWDHKNLTDFWRIGAGYERRLHALRLFTMGDIARCSIGKDSDYHNEELLYKTFGVNAELLIDHAWGYESVTIKEIKAYRPEGKSLGTGQVLSCAYPYEKAKMIVREMAENLSLDLVRKGLLTRQIVLMIGYDRENITKSETTPDIPLVSDRYGRTVPKPAHGSEDLGQMTASLRLITDSALRIMERTVDKSLSIRRINIAATQLKDEQSYKNEKHYIQPDLFDEVKTDELVQEKGKKERKIEEAVLAIKDRFGKNAILKGTNLQEGSTMQDRNNQIGGHDAG